MISLMTFGVSLRTFTKRRGHTGMVCDYSIPMVYNWTNQLSNIMHLMMVFFHIAVSRQKRGKILLKWLGMRSKVLSIYIYIL